MKRIATTLKTLGHPDRLRVLALLSQGELTVSELVHILDLSQPRITQYINSLEEAGLIERVREGSWVFSRLPQDGGTYSTLINTVLSTLPDNDTSLVQDREKLAEVRAERARQVDAFFASVANNQEQLGHEYLPQADIEAAMLDCLPEAKLGTMIDLGTGTGRMLQVFAPHIEQGIGIDSSAEMLRVARHILADTEDCQISVQQADLKNTDFKSGCADLVTLHQVLHFLDDPILAVKEASRLLTPQGHLIITDFEHHENEDFREHFSHRRLGFQDTEMQRFLKENALELETVLNVPSHKPNIPTVKIWHARQPDNASSSIG